MKGWREILAAASGKSAERIPHEKLAGIQGSNHRGFRNRVPILMNLSFVSRIPFLFLLALMPQSAVAKSVPPSGQTAPAMKEALIPSPAAGRPILWTTDDLLERAKKRVAENREPFRTAWTQTVRRADLALTQTFEPYQGTEYLRYYHTARTQAQHARDLAIVFHITGDDRRAARAKEILLDWANEFHRVSRFPESYPASEVRHGAGLVIGRTVAIFADAYALLHDQLDAADRASITRWFRGLIAPLQEELRIWHSQPVKSFEPPYLDRQFFNNHLSGCVLGVAAIGFALQDAELIRYAYEGGAPEATGDLSRWNPRDLRTLINGAIFMPGDFGSGEEGDVWQGPPGDPSLRGAPEPLPGEIYDRYRVIQGHGIHYTLFHLRLLTLMAEMARNNLNTPWYDGPDFFDYTGPRGENLAVSFSVYAEWFITLDPASVNHGYYVDWAPKDQPKPALGGDLNALVIYELARFRYPGNERIRAALAARQAAGNRAHFDEETFAWTALLCYGEDL